jgi:hypothetical protein
LEDHLFFELALDILGNLVPFKRFEGDVTICMSPLLWLYQFALQGLVQLWNQVKQTGRIQSPSPFPVQSNLGLQEPKAK